MTHCTYTYTQYEKRVVKALAEDTVADKPEGVHGNSTNLSSGWHNICHDYNSVLTVITATYTILYRFMLS